MQVKLSALLCTFTECFELSTLQSVINMYAMQTHLTVAHSPYQLQ